MCNTLRKYANRGCRLSSSQIGISLDIFLFDHFLHTGILLNFTIEPHIFSLQKVTTQSFEKSIEISQIKFFFIELSLIKYVFCT